jgi:hypothetical protein
MWNRIGLIGIAAAIAFGSVAAAKDVQVRGYTRKDGTYVAPTIRSAPDSSKANNYGPSKTAAERLTLRTRDADKDGTPNYLDRDDNNNGVPDDKDPKQYRQGTRRQ